MAWRPESAAPVVHQPEGFGGAPFRSQPYDQEEGIPPSKPPRGNAARLPILARMRSYSGVQRSGMISAIGLTIRREATPQRHALKRGASTCTTPNNVVDWRVRQSLMPRREPQCEHFRR